MVAALKSEHFNRICESASLIIQFALGKTHSGDAEAISELRHLTIWVYDDVASPLPDSFLGGSAPRLRTLSLRGIHFHQCQTISSANDLITLPFQIFLILVHFTRRDCHCTDGDDPTRNPST